MRLRFLQVLGQLQLLRLVEHAVVVSVGLLKLLLVFAVSLIVFLSADLTVLVFIHFLDLLLCAFLGHVGPCRNSECAKQCAFVKLI